jgi:hypothetical protein
MHLYRIMANVRAGVDQANAQRGRLGLVTVWVRSDSQQDALDRARQIISRRGYESANEPTIYLEQASTLPAAGDTSQLGMRAGYLNMRQQAIDHGDGLFELWYPEEPNESRG